MGKVCQILLEYLKELSTQIVIPFKGRQLPTTQADMTATKQNPYATYVFNLTIAGAIAIMLALFAGTIPAAQAQTYEMISANLGLGSRGANVTNLQTFLASNSLVYPEGLVTGYYGPLTERAVRNFQIAFGISAVGNVGPITRSKINGLINANLGLDVQLPKLTQTSATVSGRTANIAWQTNEGVSSRITYGRNPIIMLEASGTDRGPSINGEAIMVDSSFGTGKTTQLTNLSANQTYYFVVEATDSSGNVGVSSQMSFIAGL